MLGIHSDVFQAPLCDDPEICPIRNAVVLKPL